MSDFPVEGDQTSVADDTAYDDEPEDQSFDTLEDAAAALADDDEGEGPEPETSEDDIEGEEADEPGEVKLTLSDGTALTLEEVEKGFLREADYTRKTMELAETRKAVTSREAELSEQARIVETASQRLLGLVQQLVPPMPPASLAQQNPALYIQQKAMHEQARAELGEWMGAAGEATQVVQGFTQQQIEQRKAEANAELVRAMPRLKDPAAMAKFDADVLASAKSLGFDEATIAATTDPKVRRMAYLAAIGQRALDNQKAAARRVEAPKAGKPPAPGKPTDAKAIAARRFKQTGSIYDAAKVDFD